MSVSTLTRNRTSTSKFEAEKRSVDQEEKAYRQTTNRATRNALPRIDSAEEMELFPYYFIRHTTTTIVHHFFINILTITYISCLVLDVRIKAQWTLTFVLLFVYHAKDQYGCVYFLEFFVSVCLGLFLRSCFSCSKRAFFFLIQVSLRTLRTSSTPLPKFFSASPASSST